MKLKLALIATFLLSACSHKSPSILKITAVHVQETHFLPQKLPIGTEKLLSGAEIERSLASIAETKAMEYGLDPLLLTAIIQVESKWNPAAVSRSNAIGLMQIKANTAGREVYRLRGKFGEPSTSQLKDPAINIDIGAAYLQHLQRTALSGIRDPLTLRYATIVAYVTFQHNSNNGLITLLNLFDNRLYHL